jgi:hypothetical protein
MLKGFKLLIINDLDETGRGVAAIGATMPAIVYGEPTAVQLESMPSR